ncbi:MAG: type II toxin-antitoxin system VapC family toxin [Thermogemmata sp.]|nr:type II toxin-antitoxin system VapC family toxin [Gemmataceae bacterium]
MIVYFDASALVKRYVEEEGSALVRDLLTSEPIVATSVISLVEVTAALARAKHGGRLPPQEADLAKETFLHEWQDKDMALIALTDSTVSQAIQLAWTHHLRAYDAVQLASALFCRNEWDQETLLATFDKELWEAAQAEGITPWPEKLE